VAHTPRRTRGRRELLGVYSTEERALRRIEKAKRLPASLKVSDGFEVDRISVDLDLWPDGFVTIVHD
jgi:hypothetical protein